MKDSGSKSLLIMSLKGKLLDNLFDYSVDTFAVFSLFLISIQFLTLIAFIVFGIIKQSNNTSNLICVTVNIFISIGLLIIICIKNKKYEKSRKVLITCFDDLDRIIEAAEENDYDNLLAIIIQERNNLKNEEIKTKEIKK